MSALEEGSVFFGHLTTNLDITSFAVASLA